MNVSSPLKDLYVELLKNPAQPPEACSSHDILGKAIWIKYIVILSQ